jgi:hypothetical protein
MKVVHKVSVRGTSQDNAPRVKAVLPAQSKGGIFPSKQAPKLHRTDFIPPTHAPKALGKVPSAPPLHKPKTDSQVQSIPPASKAYTGTSINKMLGI